MRANRKASYVARSFEFVPRAKPMQGAMIRPIRKCAGRVEMLRNLLVGGLLLGEFHTDQEHQWLV